MLRQHPIQNRVKTPAFVSRAGFKTAGKPGVLYRYKSAGFYPPVIRVPYGELEKRYLRSFRNISYEIFRCPRGARTGTPIFGDRLLFRSRENRKAMTKDQVRHERPLAVRLSQSTARKNVRTEGRAPWWERAVPPLCARPLLQRLLTEQAYCGPLLPSVPSIQHGKLVSRFPCPRLDRVL